MRLQVPQPPRVFESRGAGAGDESTWASTSSIPRRTASRSTLPTSPSAPSRNGSTTKGFEIVSGESVRIPTDVKELDAEGRESVEKLVEKLEDDDDVVNVYHTMKEAEEE